MNEIEELLGIYISRCPRLCYCLENRFAIPRIADPMICFRVTNLIYYVRDTFFGNAHYIWKHLGQRWGPGGCDSLTKCHMGEGWGQENCYVTFFSFFMKFYQKKPCKRYFFNKRKNVTPQGYHIGGSKISPKVSLIIWLAPMMKNQTSFKTISHFYV